MKTLTTIALAMICGSVFAAEAPKAPAKAEAPKAEAAVTQPTKRESKKQDAPAPQKDVEAIMNDWATDD